MAIGQWTDTSDLVPGYRHAKRIVERLRCNASAHDKPILGGMVSECEFIAQWIHCGRMPGDYHGVSKRNSRPWETDWINEYRSPNGYTIDRIENEGLNDEQREKIKKALFGLSRREIQCYMLHVVDGLSFGDIGLELHLGKSTVQYYIDLAKKKIELNKNTSLFHVE